MAQAMNSFPIIAAPLFILMGNLLSAARITDRIIAFATALIGWVRGGYAHAYILASMIFAGMSGSAVADAGGVGTLEIKAMKDEGYDAETGKHLWRTYTVPAKGEPGSETWPDDSALTGGGSSWVTGSYDPELDLVFWGISNPAPWNPRARKGDNLYTNSAVALDIETGKLKLPLCIRSRSVGLLRVVRDIA